MTYEIGNGGLRAQISSLPSTAPSAPIQPKPEDSAEVKNADSAVTGSDWANVSSVGGLVSQALEGSDVRSAKVASLQSAIASGEYKVPASQVADKLLKSMLE